MHAAIDDSRSLKSVSILGSLGKFGLQMFLSFLCLD